MSHNGQPTRGTAAAAAANATSAAPAHPVSDRAKLLKRDLTAAFVRVHQCTTDAELASAVDTQRQNVQRWRSPDEPHTPTLIHLCRMPDAEFQLVMARVLELRQRDGHAPLCVESLAGVDFGSHVTLLAALHKEGGDLAATFAADIADGHIDDAGAVEREADELINVARGFKRAARRAAR